MVTIFENFGKCSNVTDTEKKLRKLNINIFHSNDLNDSIEFKNYDKKIIMSLTKNGVTKKNGLVCLAGYMRIISPHFIKKYRNRILNIHPAILPAFPGLDAQKQAIQFGAKVSGCTVHIVDEGVDTGPIILQDIVKVASTDTEETLSKKILAKEHKIYPKAIELFAKKKLSIKGRDVKILN